MTTADINGQLMPVRPGNIRRTSREPPPGSSPFFWTIRAAAKAVGQTTGLAPPSMLIAVPVVNPA
jgi:hypothetical protein